MDRSAKMSLSDGRGESYVDPGIQLGSGRTAPAIPLLRFVSNGTGYENRKHQHRILVAEEERLTSLIFRLVYNPSR